MKEKQILKKDLQRGDIILLYSWEELSEKFIHENDGNLVADNGHRSFVAEREKYGKYYMVLSSNTSIFWGTQVNCIGKREICPEEIKRVIKPHTKMYNNVYNKLNL